MTKQELISRCEELKSDCRQAHRLDQDFYELLLDEYAVNAWALKYAKDEYPWQQILELQEQYDAIEARLPNVVDTEFEEYIILGDLLEVLLR